MYEFRMSLKPKAKNYKALSAHSKSFDDEFDFEDIKLQI